MFSGHSVSEATSTGQRAHSSIDERKIVAFGLNEKRNLPPTLFIKCFTISFQHDKTQKIIKKKVCFYVVSVISKVCWFSDLLMLKIYKYDKKYIACVCVVDKDKTFPHSIENKNKNTKGSLMLKDASL